MISHPTTTEKQNTPPVERMENFTVEDNEGVLFGEKLIRIKVLDSRWKDASGIVMNKQFCKNFEKVRNLEVFSDDVWMLCYPKTGSTWAQEMIWLLNNDLDFETANKVKQIERFPFFDSSYMLDYDPESMKSKIEFNSETLQRPRHIKSHLAPPLLPLQIWEKKPKIIHISRNPKDVALSRFHYQSKIFGYPGSLETFLDDFLEDRLVFHPFIEHCLMCWNLEKEGYPNILYLTYEEMLKDIDGVIKKTQKFLGKSYTQDQIEKLKNHLSFNNMKHNNAVNRSHQVEDPNLEKTLFMRKGTSGNYKTEMPEKYIKKFDEWLKKSLENKEHRFNLD